MGTQSKDLVLQIKLKKAIQLLIESLPSYVVIFNLVESFLSLFTDYRREDTENRTILNDVMCSWVPVGIQMGEVVYLQTCS